MLGSSGSDNRRAKEEKGEEEDNVSQSLRQSHKCSTLSFTSHLKGKRKVG